MSPKVRIWHAVRRFEAKSAQERETAVVYGLGLVLLMALLWRAI